jgi:ABC-2 type transport system permease protein
MKSIIFWTLKQKRNSTIWWSLSISIFLFINMIFYPSFKNDADELQKSFENLPDAALQLLGGSSDFFSPIGYINSQVFFIMLPMILGILAIALGAGLLAREEQDKTIESLLSRPVSRSKLLSSKALSGILVLFIVTLVGLITTIVTAKIVDLEVGTSALIQATSVCFLLTVSFGAIAYLLTATGKARGASIGVATFVALGGYIIGSLAGTVSWLSAPSKLFPFHYYQSEAILRGTYNWNNLWYFVGVIFLCAGLSWFAFRRRDLA